MGDEEIDILQGVAGRLGDAVDGIDQNSRGPLEHRPAVHLHVVSAGADAVAGRRHGRAAHGDADQTGPGAVGPQRIGQQPLIGPAAADQHRPGGVAEQGVHFLVPGVHDPRQRLAADHQGSLASAGGDVLHRRDHGVHEAGAGGLHVHRRARES